jgi:hypothetical protein
LQGWPDELPLIINGTLDTGKNGAKEYGWQLDIPVVFFGFGFCITVLLILVQVSYRRMLYEIHVQIEVIINHAIKCCKYTNLPLS